MLLALIPDPLRWPIGGADADRGKAGFELALRPGPPAHRLPFGIGQHTTEAHASRGHAIDLSERDLRLGTCRSIFDRNTCTLQPR